jgi:hypothetical protein
MSNAYCALATLFTRAFKFQSFEPSEHKTREASIPSYIITNLNHGHKSIPVCDNDTPFIIDKSVSCAQQETMRRQRQVSCCCDDEAPRRVLPAEDGGETNWWLQIPDEVLAQIIHMTSADPKDLMGLEVSCRSLQQSHLSLLEDSRQGSLRC